VSEALRNWDNDTFAAALGASLSSGYSWDVLQAQVLLERIVATWATARETLKCGKCRGCGNTAPGALTGDCGRWANLSEAFMGIVPMHAWMPVFTHRSPVSFGMSPNATSLVVHEQHIIALLQMGVLTDVYRPGTDDDTPFLPFIRMCRVGATRVVRYMAERRPSVVNEKQPLFDQPPLIAALLEGHVDTANALLDLGADPKVPMRVHGMTTAYPVSAAVFVDREGAILPRLLDMHPEMLDWKNEALVTRLRDAVCHRNIRAIEELLRRGARADDVSRAGRTLLMEPFYNSDLSVATTLLEGGAAAAGRAPLDACLASLLTAAQMAVDTPVPCGGCRACLGVPLESRAAAHRSLRIDCRDAFPVFELALKHLAPGAVHMLLPKNCGDLAECAYLPAAIVDGTPTPDCEARVIRALKLLREHGFDIAGPGHGGMTTPLHMAANRSLTRVIEF
jgi:ankyrin repeat protein